MHRLMSMKDISLYYMIISSHYNDESLTYCVEHLSDCPHDDHWLFGKPLLASPALLGCLRLHWVPFCITFGALCIGN